MAEEKNGAANGPTTADLRLFDAVLKNNATGIKDALKTGANVNATLTPEGGMTALHMAAENGKDKALQTLLAVPGIDVNVQSQDYPPPLISAAYRGQGNSVKVLLADRRTDLDLPELTPPPLFDTVERTVPVPAKSAEDNKPVALFESRAETVQVPSTTPFFSELRKVAKTAPDTFNPIIDLIEKAKTQREKEAAPSAEQGTSSKPPRNADLDVMLAKGPSGQAKYEGGSPRTPASPLGDQKGVGV